MKRACLWAVAAVAASVPNVASAALTLNIESATVQTSTSDTTGFLEVFFTETAPRGQ
jgi:hypothetical protein